MRYQSFFNALDRFIVGCAQLRSFINAPIKSYMPTAMLISGNPFLALATWFMDVSIVEIFFSSFLMLLAVVSIFRFIRLINVLS